MATKLKVRKSSKYPSVLALFGSSRRWTKGHYAFDKEGNRCDATDPAAKRWCMVGAIWHVYGRRDTGSAAIDRLDKTLYFLGFKEGVTVFNDDPRRRFQTVKRIVRLAGI